VAEEVIAAPAPKQAESVAASYDLAELEREESTEGAADDGIAAVTPPSPAEPKAPPPPKHAPHTLRMAADLGIPQADIDGASAEELGRLVYHLHRQVLTEARESRRQEAQNGRQNVQPAVVAPPQAPDGPDWGKDDNGKAFTEADYAPGVAAVIKKSHALEKKVQDLEARLEALGSREQARERESAGDRIDRLFDSLGDEGAKRFGKGTWRDFTEDSPEYQRRMAVLLLMDKDRRGSLEARFKRAHDTIYGGVVLPDGASAKGGKGAEPTPPPTRPKRPDGTFKSDSELNDDERAWMNGGLARPTQRKGAPEPTGTKKAEKAVEAALKEMHADGGTSLDEFLE
jgi:hypothetical protein